MNYPPHNLYDQLATRTWNIQKTSWSVKTIITLLWLQYSPGIFTRYCPFIMLIYQQHLPTASLPHKPRSHNTLTLSDHIRMELHAKKKPYKHNAIACIQFLMTKPYTDPCKPSFMDTNVSAITLYPEPRNTVIRQIRCSSKLREGIKLIDLMMFNPSLKMYRVCHNCKSTIT